MKSAAAGAALLLVALLFLGGVASAHALLRSANPGPNDALPRSPAKVQLTFSENLEPSYSFIKVFDPSKAQVDNRDTKVSATDPRVMEVTLPPLGNGTYTVTWQALSAVDGHVTKGSYVFAVGSAPPGACTDCPSSSPPPSPLEVAARWAAYLSLAIATGGFGFLLLVWIPAVASLGLPARRTKSSPSFLDIPGRSATAALLASGALVASVFALLVLFSANTSDRPPAEAIPQALASSFGRDLLARLATGGLLVAASLGLRRVALRPGPARAPRGLPAANGGRPAGRPFFRGLLDGFRPPPQEDLRPLWRAALGGFLLSLASVATFSVASHGAATVPPLGAAFDFLHLAAIALWVGGLFHVTFAAMPKLARSTSPRAGALSAEVAGNFSALATLMVGALLLSGGYLAIETVGSLDALAGTAYGQALLAKLALFIPLVALGAYNHFRLRPSLAHTRDLEEDSAVHRRRFLRTTRLEALLGASILVAAGLMAALTPAASLAPPSHPPTYQALRTVDGINIEFDISPYPAGAGNYTFTVLLTDTGGNPYNGARAVLLVLADAAGNVPPTTLNLTSIHGFHFESQATAFPVGGTWSIAMTIRRSDGPDISTTFVVQV